MEMATKYQFSKEEIEQIRNARIIGLGSEIKTAAKVKGGIRCRARETVEIPQAEIEWVYRS